MGWTPFSQVAVLATDIAAHPRYYWMACCACWGSMLFGWDTGLIGGVLPQKAFQASFGLTTNSRAYADLSGWVVTTLQAGCFFGALSCMFFAEKFGRRPSFFIAGATFLLGSLLQIVCATGGQSHATALNQLYVGRVIGGFGVGMVSVLTPTYISECAPKHIRGRLTGMHQLFIVTGIALSFWINYAYLRRYGEDPTKEAVWRIPFLLQIIPGVLLIVSMIWEKESPRWLSERGRFDEARVVIARLARQPIDHPNVIAEAEEIRVDLENRVRLTFIQQWKEITSSPKMFYRCSLPVVMMFWQQWTGANAMNYYSPIIFQELGLKGDQASLLGTGIYGIVKIVMTVLVLSLGVEQYGRKALLVWGGLGQALPMFYIAGYRQIREDSPEIDGASYTAIAMIYLYVTFYSFGWSVAPWPAMSEAVPNHLRSIAMSAGLMSNWLFNFIISKITPILLVDIKWGTYLLYACTTLCATFWAVLFLPETGGYAIEDIHQLFEGSIVKRSLHDNAYLFKTYNNRPQSAANHRHRSELEAQQEKGTDISSIRKDTVDGI